MMGAIWTHPDDMPANTVMAEYFSPSTAATSYRGHPRTSLPVVLDIDFQLKTSAENGRLSWQELTDDIMCSGASGVMV